MDAVIAALLATVRLGDGRSEQGLTLIPVFSTMSAGPSYVGLGTAMEQADLVVTEVDNGGRVPQLRAANGGDAAVLILDGEELAGAKQNRVLNTTVLIMPGKEVLIPVSCTEAGRWRSMSPKFADSGYIAARGVRSAAKQSVTANVRVSGCFESNQGRVWAEVDEIAMRHDVEPRTSAMRDVFEHRKGALAALADRFPLHEKQAGLMAVYNGRVIGVDVLSRPEVYAGVHRKLVTSYAIDAIGESGGAGTDDAHVAKEFLVRLSDADSSRHDSPGSGSSHRFTGPGFVGDALTYRSSVVHAAFFATDDFPGSAMTPARLRRERRIY